MKAHLTALVVAFVVAGCANLDEQRRSDRTSVEAEMFERTGLRLRDRGFERVDEAPAELSADAAVRVALASDPRVDELLAQLEQASAERVVAELVRNPLVRVELLFASGDADVGAGLVQPLADLLTLAHRRSIAVERNEAERMRIARELVRLVHDVRRAFSSASFDARVAALAEERREAEEAAARLARTLHAAGNTTTVALHEQLAQAAEAQAAAARAQARATASRAALANAIGRPQWAEDIVLARTPTPSAPGDTTTVAEAVLAANLELREHRARTREHARAAGLAPLEAWTDGTALEAEHVDSSTALELSLPVPVFDRGDARSAARQAVFAAARADEQRVALDVLAALAHVDVQRRSAHTRLEAARTQSVPNAVALVVASLQQYNAMQVDVFAVLDARRSEFEARADELDAARELDWYEIAFAELAAGSTPPFTDGPELAVETD
jgi:outer membrane protein TolC